MKKVSLKWHPQPSSVCLVFTKQTAKVNTILQSIQRFGSHYERAVWDLHPELMAKSPAISLFLSFSCPVSTCVP